MGFGLFGSDEAKEQSVEDVVADNKDDVNEELKDPGAEGPPYEEKAQAKENESFFRDLKSRSFISLKMAERHLEVIEENLEEWTEENDTETVSYRQMRLSNDLPSYRSAEQYYPSIRDFVVENGYTYTRANWESDVSMEEEQYPEGFETSAERDMYVFYENENMDNYGFAGSARTLGIELADVITVLGPLSQADEVRAE